MDLQEQGGESLVGFGGRERMGEMMQFTHGE